MRVLAVVAVLFAWIPSCWQPLRGQSPSVGEQTGKNNVKNPKFGTAKATANQIGTEASPIIVDIKQHPKSEAEAAKDKRKDDTNEYRARWTFHLTIVNAVISGLLLIIGTGGVYAAIRTLREIKRQADLMEAQTKALIESERAWVTGDIAPLSDDFRSPTDPNRLEIFWVFPTIQNYGKNPARLTRIAVATRLVLEGEELPAEPRYATGLDETIDSVLPPMVPFRPRVGVSSTDIIQARERNGTLYVYGLVEYVDIGQIQRSSAFCFFFAEQRGFSPNPA